LKLTKPKMDNAGTRLSREGIPLTWSFDGTSPYLSVRINQRDDEKKLTRSLTCRFKNDGSAKITAEQLKPFYKDPTGQKTHIFFFSSKWSLPKLKGFDEPMFFLTEAITTSPAILD